MPDPITPTTAPTTATPATTTPEAKPAEAAADEPKFTGRESTRQRSIERALAKVGKADPKEPAPEPSDEKTPEPVEVPPAAAEAKPEAEKKPEKEETRAEIRRRELALMQRDRQLAERERRLREYEEVAAQREQHRASIPDMRQDLPGFLKAHGVGVRDLIETLMEHSRNNAPPEPVDPVVELRQQIAELKAERERERTSQQEAYATQQLISEQATIIRQRVAPVLDPERHEALLLAHDGDANSAAVELFKYAETHHTSTGEPFHARSFHERADELADLYAGQLDPRVEKLAKSKRYGSKFLQAVQATPPAPRTLTSNHNPGVGAPPTNGSSSRYDRMSNIERALAKVRSA